ncbi:MAG: hypothetical protein ACE5ID_07335 [Acidobacteriota bacterium]
MASTTSIRGVTAGMMVSIPAMAAVCIRDMMTGATILIPARIMMEWTTGTAAAGACTSPGAAPPGGSSCRGRLVGRL